MKARAARPARLLPHLACAGGLWTGATAAMAGEANWEFEGTFYIFAADTTLSVDGTESELSFSEALDNLDFGAMGVFAARNGPWTFVADLMYFDLLFENDTPGNAFSGLEADTDMTVFTALGYYNVLAAPGYALHLGGGLRYFETDTTLTLRAGVLPERKLVESDSWTDPLVAALGQYDLSQTWRATLAADYGGFVRDRETAQITLTLDHDFAPDWTARIGYRYLRVDNAAEDFESELTGPILGVSDRF